MEEADRARLCRVSRVLDRGWGFVLLTGKARDVFTRE